MLALGVGCTNLIAQTWTPDNGNGTYSNPLFFDEFADPDIIRVGQDFYLTGSSMHSMPGLAVLHSRDLLNWKFESYAMDKLDLGPEYRLEDGKNGCAPTANTFLNSRVSATAAMESRFIRSAIPSAW
jgi:beta-xylosidase